MTHTTAEELHLFAWRGEGHTAHAYPLTDTTGISACGRRVAGFRSSHESDLPRCRDCLLIVLRAVDHNAKVIAVLAADFDASFPPEPRDVVGDEMRRLDGEYGIGSGWGIEG